MWYKCLQMFFKTTCTSRCNVLTGNLDLPGFIRGLIRVTLSLKMLYATCFFKKRSQTVPAQDSSKKHHQKVFTAITELHFGLFGITEFVRLREKTSGRAWEDVWHWSQMTCTPVGEASCFIWRWVGVQNHIKYQSTLINIHLMNVFII